MQWCVFFDEVYVKVVSPLFSQVVCFLIVACQEFLTHFGQQCLLQIFSQSLYLSSNSFDIVFHKAVFNFNEVQIISFIPFVYYAYAAESKKLLP